MGGDWDNWKSGDWDKKDAWGGGGGSGSSWGGGGWKDDKDKDWGASIGGQGDKWSGGWSEKPKDGWEEKGTQDWDKKGSWGESGKPDAWGDDGSFKKPNYEELKAKHEAAGLVAWEREPDKNKVEEEVEALDDEGNVKYGEDGKVLKQDRLDRIRAVDTDEVHVLNGDPRELISWPTWEKVREGMPSGLVDIMEHGPDGYGGFRAPTAIQQFAWPALVTKKDFIGVAKTGSGKTLAYMIPAFIAAKIEETKKPESTWDHQPHAHPHTLAVAPTRELTHQIFEECVKFGTPAGLRTCEVFGGEGNSKDQKWQLVDKNPHCICATPGRLQDYLDKGLVSLVDCKFVILDEADRMLDMGFELDVRMIVEQCPDGTSFDCGGEGSVSAESDVFLLFCE